MLFFPYILSGWGVFFLLSTTCKNISFLVLLLYLFSALGFVLLSFFSCTNAMDTCLNGRRSIEATGY